MTELLEIDDLRVAYPVRRGIIESLTRKPRQHVRAVDGVDLHVGRGEMVALVGESGCGKTTIAQSILGAVAPTSGAIRLDGSDITSMSQRQLRAARRRVQMIYQDPYASLDPRFTVADTIEEPMLIHGIGASRAERKALIATALERTGLAPAELYVDRFPHELSGGQRQRVAIAASLAVGPDLLVADEPVSMLDVSVRASILLLLDRLRKDTGVGVLMITHDLSTAIHFADRIAVMYLGRIVELAPAREVAHNPQHPYTKALMSVIPHPDPQRQVRPQILRGDTPNPANVPSGCRFHTRCPIGPTVRLDRQQCIDTDPSDGAERRLNSAACHFTALRDGRDSDYVHGETSSIVDGEGTDIVSSVDHRHDRRRSLGVTRTTP